MIRVPPTPRSADLEVTHRCNARCRYCYFYGNEGVVYRDLPTDRWLALIDELGQAAVMRVTLAGGEPLLREDVCELVERIAWNRMRWELLTNGWPVTDEVASRLQAIGRCDSIEVSLDAARAEVHDTLRGQGSFTAALKAIRILRAHGLPVVVRVNVHAYNVEELPGVAHLLLEELRLPFIRCAGVAPIGTRSKYGEGLFPSAAQRLKAMRSLAALDIKYPTRIRAASGPLAEWKMFQRMEAVRRSGEHIAGCGYLVGCGCVFSRISVRSDGAYVPCVLLPQLVAGYIGEIALEEVWLRSPVLDGVRQRVRIPLASFAECQGCDYIASCTGSCAGPALSILGEVNRPSPDSCLRRFLQELSAQGLALWPES